MEGAGTKSSPYRIQTVEEFLAIRDLSAFYQLEKNLDFSALPKDYHYTPIGGVSAPFTGAFIGNGNRLCRLNARVSGGKCGLFGLVGTLGVIHGLELVDVALTVDMQNAVYFSDTRTDPKAGPRICAGLIAGESTGEISDCLIIGSSLYITCGNVFAGSVCGRSSGKIDQCAFLGTLNAQGAGSCAGGVVGKNEGAVSRCWSDGNLTAESVDSATCIGALAGMNTSNGLLMDCWSRAGVSARNIAGGLTGQNYGPIYRSYTQSKMNPYPRLRGGAIAGVTDSVQCFFDCVFDPPSMGCFVPCCTGNGHGARHTVDTSEMHRRETFPGFDFSTIWGLSPDRDFGVPYLRDRPYPDKRVRDGHSVCIDAMKKGNFTATNEPLKSEIYRPKNREVNRMQENQSEVIETYMAWTENEKNQSAPVSMSVAVGFTLLNVQLIGTYESHSDGSKELLIEPSVSYIAEPYTLVDLLKGVNQFFQDMAGSSAAQLSLETVQKSLEQFLKNLQLDKLSVALNQIFLHVKKPKSGETTMEYALSLKLENGSGATPKDFTFASLNSIAFGVWNTDNKRILAGMGLLSIAEQLGL